MISRLLKRFRNIYENENNLSSYENYYKALCIWIENNRKVIPEELLKQNDLIMLTSLDLDKYLVKNNEIDLQNEKQRMSFLFNSVKSPSLDRLLSLISERMFEMVTISADAECGRYTTGEVRYMIVKDIYDNEKMMLECRDCGYAMHLDRSHFDDDILEYRPATQKEVQELLSNKERKI